MSQPFRLPDIPDPPPNHRLRTFTFLFTAFTLVASVGADSYRDGPVGNREHVFTHLGASMRAALRSVTGGEEPPAPPPPPAKRRS